MRADFSSLQLCLNHPSLRSKLFRHFTRGRDQAWEKFKFFASCFAREKNTCDIESVTEEDRRKFVEKAAKVTQLS